MEGLVARPGYTTCYANLEQYMPELLSTYNRLVELAGGGDLAARFLSLFSPPPYMSGCSQIVWQRERPTLIRNYDYSPYYFEGVVMYTHWLRPVIAMSDCNWGVLDGINDAGLCVSLTFGGSKSVGKGFGIPLILRYVLETATSAYEAVAILKKIPVHMAYNVTVLDAHGYHATVFLYPDREPIVTEYLIATNHQTVITWEAYAELTATKERLAFLESCLANPYETETSLLQKFFEPPLYNTRFEKGFGTLYTALYHPRDAMVKFLWKSKKVVQSFQNYEERCFTIDLYPGRAGRMLV